MFCIQKDIPMRSGGCGTDFFLSFNIGGVLGNYTMKFEIQSGVAAAASIFVLHSPLYVLPFEKYSLVELFKGGLISESFSL